MTSNTCRFCSGELENKFQALILQKHSVNYFLCKKCLSLQTEFPFWLDEAYLNWSTKFDTGIYSRVKTSFLVSFLISKLFKFKNILDYGGGDGLFCRIMRDHNFNCYSYDKYAKPVYSLGFTKPNFSNPDLITCFEAVEHFSEPKKEFTTMFETKPKAILLTTSLYFNQEKNWNYLELETGQHIFFYSKKAIEMIAKKYDYHVKFLECGFIFLYRSQYNINQIYLYLIKKILIRKKIIPLINLILLFTNTNGHEKDYK